MAPMTQRRFATSVDDDDDSDLYDPKYPGQRVVRDGKGFRVPIMLTDAMPPEYRAAMYPHYVAATDSVELRDAEPEAERAYYERNAELENAWRSPGNPPSPPPRPGESARDAYVRELGEAWRTPPPGGNGRGDPASAANANQAAVDRMLKLGARPGDDGRRRPAQDAVAARADADLAYAEYVDRISNAWRR